ncbi:hypothetical protein AB837_00246 [bacterium AB1]|nr:hypothetical protein AB837_00246 [bacterium AB1]
MVDILIPDEVYQILQENNITVQKFVWRVLKFGVVFIDVNMWFNKEFKYLTKEDKKNCKIYSIRLPNPSLLYSIGKRPYVIANVAMYLLKHNNKNFNLET